MRNHVLTLPATILGEVFSPIMSADRAVTVVGIAFAASSTKRPAT
jgi:hypothetical protein